MTDCVWGVSPTPLNYRYPSKKKILKKAFYSLEFKLYRERLCRVSDKSCPKPVVSKLGLNAFRTPKILLEIWTASA